MTHLRRSTDRRRRVLYQAHVAPGVESTPAARRATESMRAARQPAGDFGSRVHRHLRGRWFSLVPVSRMAVTIVCGVILMLPAMLTLLHHLALTWPTLAYRAEIARPLYLNRPDSFAAWWMTMILVLSAGATRLIYVLREHRRDDYRGHYQLWRLTLIVVLLACVNSVVGLVQWAGAWVDLLVGDRAVLSGANWLRIVLDVGGIILAMRLIAEVRHCRASLIAMIASGIWFGWFEAATWGMVSIDSFGESTLVTAAPLLGWSCFLVAATAYLRLMYRSIRNIPVEPTLRERLELWREERRHLNDEIESDFFDPKPTVRPAAVRPAAASVKTKPAEKTAQPGSSRQSTRPGSSPAASTEERQRPRSQASVKPVAQSATEEESSRDTSDPGETKKGLFSRFRRTKKAELDTNDEHRDDEQADDAQAESSDESSEDIRPKRRWFGLRAAKQVADDGTVDGEDVSEQDDQPVAKDSDDPPAPKKRWFSLRLKPQAVANSDDADEDSSESKQSDDQPAEATADDDAPKEKKGWFGGWLRRKKSAADAETADSEDDSNTDSETNTQAPSRMSKRGGPLSAASRRQSSPGASAAASVSQSNGATQANASLSDDDLPDSDDIDWDSMSKSERRRMRKKLKRSGRAA